MKLVLYSGGQVRTNETLHDALSQMVGNKRRKTLTYVPFCFDGSQPYFEKATKRYQKFGFTNFQCLPLDKGVDEAAIKKALGSDVIYLAGGNTFYFLNHLSRTGMLPKLRRFAKDGGVVAGLSAGAILMTPHIGLAGYPYFDKDENDVGLRNYEALNLVKFEFFPHYADSRRRLRDALQIYSTVSKYPIFACKDGGGIIVEKGQTHLVGDVTMFATGTITKLAQE